MDNRQEQRQPDQASCCHACYFTCNSTAQSFPHVLVANRIASVAEKKKRKGDLDKSAHFESSCVPPFKKRTKGKGENVFHLFLYVYKIYIYHIYYRMYLINVTKNFINIVL